MATSKHVPIKHAPGHQEFIAQTLNVETDRFAQAVFGPLTVSLAGISSPHPLSSDVAFYQVLRFTGAAAAATLEFPTTVTLSGEDPVTLTRAWMLKNESGQTLTFQVAGGANSFSLSDGQKCLAYSDGAELEQMTAAL